MGFVLSYKLLFELKIIHHYFLDKTTQIFDTLTNKEKNLYLKQYNLENFLSIYPTKETIKKIGNNKCIYKNTMGGILLGLESKEQSGKNFPIYDLDGNLNFTFFISLKESTFFNYTSLPLRKSNSTVFFFSNKTSLFPKKFPYLSKNPSVFQAGSKYSAGDILTDNSSNPTKIFIAKNATNSTPPSTDWIDDPLVSGKPLQYVTENDLLPIFKDIMNFNTGRSGLNLTITLKNDLNEILSPKKEIIESDATKIQLFLLEFPEGIYYIKLEDAGAAYLKEFYFFLSKESMDDVLGVLHLYIKSDDTNYDMLNTDNSLKEPTYELRFKNRHTMWRYLGEKYTAKPESGPYPLTKYGYINVSIQDDSSNMADELPNPSINMIKSELDTTHTNNYNVISEIYINS